MKSESQSQLTKVKITAEQIPLRSIFFIEAYTKGLPASNLQRRVDRFTEEEKLAVLLYLEQEYIPIPDCLKNS